jgi:hypothetical protein
VLDIVKIFGVNGTVLGVVTLTDIELILKITLLVVTLFWSVGKCVEQWRKLKNPND